MIEIWTEFARFNITNQRHADQVRTITKMVGCLTLKYWKSTNKYIGNISTHPYYSNRGTKYKKARNSKPTTTWQWLIHWKRTKRKTLTQEEKIIVDIIKRIIHVWNKKYITFFQESRLEDSQVQNRKSERLIDKYPDKRHHGVNQFEICRSKISL